jgi:hypothetical protein
MLLLHISFYIFKTIIFQNIELGFEIFKNLKVEGSYIYRIYCFVISKYKCVYKIYLSLMFLIMCVMI